MLSGNWIPRPFQANKAKQVNPFVKVSVLYSGLGDQGKVECTQGEMRTETVYDNGFNPEFKVCTDNDPYMRCPVCAREASPFLAVGQT